VTGSGQRDVLPERGRVPHVVLEQSGHRRTLLPRVDAVDRDPPRLGAIEPGQQLDERGLADTVLADHRDRRDRRDRAQPHAQPVENRSFAAR
jgi:hypothetical protein